METLAQDLPKFPSAPTTSDPLTWIAMVVVLALIGILLWQLRTGREERKEEGARQEAALKTFREELAAQRVHDETRTEKTHDRISDLATEVRRLADAQTA